MLSTAYAGYYVPQSVMDCTHDELPSPIHGDNELVNSMNSMTLVNSIEWKKTNDWIIPTSHKKFGVDLKVHGQVLSGDLALSTLMLIDTGCQVSIIFRTGLFPSRYLSKARQPMNILTANGSGLPGGSKGLLLANSLPN